MDKALKVTLVQQGVWHMAKESMPLAAGYLAAVVRADPDLAERCEVRILNFRGNLTPLEMAIEVLQDGVPDVIGFSVLGWNARQFAAVAETVKQVNPEAVVVFGGNHVAHQAERVLPRDTAVDVVVNGEGEITFSALLTAVLDGTPFAAVRGISFRGEDGTVVTTEEQPRLDDLDRIPSPILTGAIPLLDDDGAFRYDVALMETNRGCPYHCSFCYWGGAVGQKVRSFSRARLRAELEALARAKADTVVLCDANFGLLRQDADFVEDFIDVRARYGYPRALETSWAKNKSKVFRDIVRRMRQEGLRSSFTLALQSLDGDVLEQMNRRNMKINQWQELAEWLADEGLDCYAELIWGVPGDTPESFLRGYDALAKHVSRIAAYPLLLLPNTDFSERREVHGFVTVRGRHDDFEYVLAARGISLEQNLQMQRFLFWARLLAENLVLRNVWPVFDSVLGWSQSTVIRSLADFIEGQYDHPGADLLRTAAGNSTADPDSLAPALEYCFSTSEFAALVEQWWHTVVEPTAPLQWRWVLHEVIRYDLDTRPLPDPERRGLPDARLITVDRETHWAVDRTYRLDVPALCRSARARQTLDAQLPGEHRRRLLFKHGFADLVRSTNHEETAHFVGRSVGAPQDSPQLIANPG
ncbi:KedN5 family methylcobalamin-dependent radical SAM C-methyltransferase [Streptomyces sp. NBC_00557]|uniref:KedN5 family methylcobalamin-dependent radical SAM C-methyltransferase n=1 Tax=Streptomyces sp. NBC_00557 TaxID=2975776 RepID=UPI002E7FC155|nr:KedN5 family methylcobalamin-dependent radical SAM C-methyltransferase [Streptomyces sp. NBC_00557]WUC39484.1 KedN5 family methylcobalamin-dependent radical SAM C-methyltransferase [Streptomyces sp. NBC_00557]